MIITVMYFIAYRTLISYVTKIPENSSDFFKHLNENVWQRLKIASLRRQEPQPADTAKWPITLRFEKILGTASVVRSIENPQDVL